MNSQIGTTPAANVGASASSVSGSLQNTIAAMRHCQICGSMRSTRQVEFRRNTGMLFARRTTILRGSICKSCVHKQFWSYQGKNLLLGPWGTISLIVTPIYFLMNSYQYGAALYHLRGAVE